MTAAIERRPTSTSGARRPWRWWLWLVVIAAFVPPSPGVAQDRQPENGQRPAVTLAQDGLSVRSADGDSTLRVRGYLQTDGRFDVGDSVGRNDTFLIRRARPVLEGRFHGRFDFKLMPDFGLGQSVLYDAYLEIRFVPAMKLRAGKFKPPIGLERLQSGADLLFAERALPTLLVPTRDVGYMLNGDLLAARLSYALALVNGVPDGTNGDLSDHQGRELDARVFVRPFAAKPGAKHDLGLGFAGSRGTLTATTAPDLPLYKTTAQHPIFTYRSDGGAAYADGRHYRLSAQGYYYAGPFGVLAEQVFSSQGLRRAGQMGELRANAWQIASSVVVTGERASYQGLIPARPFDPALHRWGGVVLAVRYSQLTVGDELFPFFVSPSDSPHAIREWAGGANWYLNRAVKVMADFEHARLEYASGFRTAENTVITRLQFAF